MKVLVAAAQMATVSICIQRWVSRSLWSGWNKWLEYDEWRQNKRAKTNQVQELFRRRDKLGSRLLLRSINSRSQEDYSIENVYIRKDSTLPYFIYIAAVLTYMYVFSMRWECDLHQLNQRKTSRRFLKLQKTNYWDCDMSRGGTRDIAWETVWKWFHSATCQCQGSPRTRKEESRRCVTVLLSEIISIWFCISLFHIF